MPGEDHETVLEIFARLGRRTGNVSTADITDATPAAAAAHVNARSCQDPTTMDACPSARKSAGGKGSIAEQLVDNEVDVLLGGGSERWDRLLEDGSQTLLDVRRRQRRLPGRRHGGRARRRRRPVRRTGSSGSSAPTT